MQCLITLSKCVLICPQLYDSKWDPSTLLPCLVLNRRLQTWILVKGGTPQDHNIMLSKDIHVWVEGAKKALRHK
jgi:hypothetical protein